MWFYFSNQDQLLFHSLEVESDNTPTNEQILKCTEYITEYLTNNDKIGYRYIGVFDEKYVYYNLTFDDHDLRIKVFHTIQDCIDAINSGYNY